MRPRSFDLFALLALLALASLALFVARDLRGSQLLIDVSGGVFVTGTAADLGAVGDHKETIAVGDRVVAIAGRDIASLAEYGDVLGALSVESDDGSGQGTVAPLTLERYRYRFTEPLQYQDVVDGGFPPSIRPTDRVVGYDRRDVRGDLDEQTILAILANRPNKSVPFDFERPVHRYNVELPLMPKTIRGWPVALFALCLVVIAVVGWRAQNVEPATRAMLAAFAGATAALPWTLLLLAEPIAALKDPILLLGGVVGLAVVRPLMVDVHRRISGGGGVRTTLVLLAPALFVGVWAAGAVIGSIGAMSEGPLAHNHDEQTFELLWGVSAFVVLTHVLDLVVMLRLRAALKTTSAPQLRAPTMGLIVASLALISGVLAWTHDPADFSISFVFHVAALITIAWFGLAVVALRAESGAADRQARNANETNPVAAVTDFLVACAEATSGRECRLVVVRGRLGLVVALDGATGEQGEERRLSVSRAPEPLRASVGLFHDEQVELPLGKAHAESVGEELAMGAGESVGLGLATLLYDEIDEPATSLGGGPTYVYLVAASASAGLAPERLDALRTSFREQWPAALRVAGEGLVAEAAALDPVARRVPVSTVEPYPPTPKRVEVVREIKVPSPELPFLRRDLGSLYPVDEPSQIPEVARDKCGAGSETDTPLILLGTPGVGKELVARWFHSQSELSTGPFIKFRVSHCPPSLRLIELLGDDDEHGCLGAAMGGVLFVEGASELADTVLDRLLHDASVSEEPVSIVLSVRCPAISTAEEHLAQLRGSIGELARGILAHRVVLLPRLSETPARVEALADFFMHRFAMKHNRVITAMTDGAKAELARRDWVAGVTELKAIVEAAVLRCETGVISADDLKVGQA